MTVVEIWYEPINFLDSDAHRLLRFEEGECNLRVEVSGEFFAARLVVPHSAVASALSGEEKVSGFVKFVHGERLRVMASQGRRRILSNLAFLERWEAGGEFVFRLDAFSDEGNILLQRAVAQEKDGSLWIAPALKSLFPELAVAEVPGG